MRAVERDLLLQHPAERLQHIAVELVLQPIGIDDLAAVMSEIDGGHLDLTGRTLHLHIGHGADICANQLVFNIGHAAAFHDVAALLLRRGPLLPLGELDQPLERFQAALVGGVDIFDPEIEGVDSSRRRELVHEAFVGISVLHPARRPDPGRPERRGFQPAADRLDVREFVGNRRVPEKYFPGTRRLVAADRSSRPR